MGSLNQTNAFLMGRGGLLSPASSGGGGFSRNYLTGTLNAGDTFTRASTGSYYTSSALLAYATSNTARFDYNPNTSTLRGLLIEPSATNLAPLNNAAVDNTGAHGETLVATLNTITGNTDAWLSTEPPSGTWSVQTGFGSTSINSGTTYTGSLYMIPGTCNRNQLEWSSSVGASYANFYESGAGSITVQSGGTASIHQLSAISGAYRASFVFTATGTNASTSAVGTNNLITGSEARAAQSPCTSRTVTFFGAQFETGSVVTSYIPTTGTAATRAADSLSFTIPSGINFLTYTFDDTTTQKVAVSAGTYTVPTNLNRPWIASILGSTT